MRNAKNKIRCASFFAGVGGIDLGFEQTDMFKVVYANEIDKYPVETYELNLPLKVDVRSICDVVPDEVPEFDVLIAGFPCTDVSIAGKQLGLYNEDGSLTRSGLFFELIKIIKAKRPRVVFLENVKNLLTHNNGKTLNEIITTLNNSGYPYVHYKVLNAMEYGNVPQNRERIYIVAYKNKEDYKKFEFPEKIPLEKSLKDIIDFNSKKSEKYYYTPGKFKGNIYEKLVEAMDDQNAVYQWRRTYVRKNKSGVVPTLTANQGSGGHNVCLVKTANGIRKMTPHECFNAQGYPEDFILPQNMADSRLYKQAGNSVCVTVVNRIAFNIAKSIM